MLIKYYIICFEVKVFFIVFQIIVIILLCLLFSKMSELLGEVYKYFIVNMQVCYVGLSFFFLSILFDLSIYVYLCDDKI